MQPFVIPSIFTAVDKYSGPLNGMGTATQNFNNKIETMNARSERMFRKLTPSLSEAGKQFLSFAGTAAVAAAIVGTARFSVDSLMKYEDELANLQALTGESGPLFDKFKAGINSVAKDTKKSAVEVTQAFTAIANNQPELAKDAEALSAVTKASINLAKAAKIELQPAGEAVTQILNQYGEGAKYAAKTVDILAAGSVAGSSEIRDTAEAIKSFGTVAKVAGVNIKESVALIELGSKFEKGAEAGVKFRNILLNMTGAKVLDKLALKDLKKAGVNLDIVSSKTLPLNERLLEMSKIGGDTNAIMHIFGKENAAMAAGILNSAGKFTEMLEAVDKTGKAEQMAATNSDTLRNRIDEAKASFVNMLTSSDNLSSGLVMAKNAMKFVSENMDTIVTVGMNVLKFFALWKVSILATKAYMAAYNIVFGINNALQKKSLFYTEGNILAKRADAITTVAMTTATSIWSTATAIATGNQIAFNAALAANPIGLIIIALVAAAAAAYALYKVFDNISKQEIAAHERREAIRQEAFSVIELRDQYLALGKTLKEAERLAVGKAAASLQGEIIAAKMQLASPLQEERDAGVQAMNKIQGKAQQLNNFSKKPSEAFSADYGQKYANTKELGTMVGSIGAPQQMSASPDWLKPAINPKMAQQQAITNTITKNNNTNATLIIKNESSSEASVKSGDKEASVMPSMTSSMSMSAAR